jgi:diadenosine tetraphosphate (Ap4A) HIT family hydrolase
VIKHAFIHVVPRHDYDLMGVVPDMENKRALPKSEMNALQKKLRGGLDAGKKN